jgi:ubiquinone/menaquinone biosynthesis C-methylase UbiE
MTDDMLALARENQRQAGVTNAEFLKGAIEEIPLPDNSVDVIISNCVINLVPDKAQVFREAYRVLKPAGRLAISDVVNINPLPAELAADKALLCGCVAGAASVQAIESWLTEAGFVDISIQVKPESREVVASWAKGRGIEDYVASANLAARKPSNAG